jgi:hypothetical protein
MLNGAISITNCKKHSHITKGWHERFNLFYLTFFHQGRLNDVVHTVDSLWTIYQELNHVKYFKDQR